MKRVFRIRQRHGNPGETRDLRVLELHKMHTLYALREESLWPSADPTLVPELNFRDAEGPHRSNSHARGPLEFFQHVTYISPGTRAGSGEPGRIAVA
jgi:hypothetical protein